MKHRRPAIIIALVMAIGAAGTATYLILHDTGGVALRPDDETYVAFGQGLYESACASCHGQHLEGQQNWRDRAPDGLLPAPPHDATGHTWHHPDEVLFKLTKFGVQPFAGPDYRSAMPAFQNRISDDDILGILSYV
jgi:S-disulfanyl-L-cysteine oxidoreductase SoxD